MSTKYATIKGKSTTNAGAIEYIANRQPFKANSMAGIYSNQGDYHYLSTGRLQSDLVALLHGHKPDFVVYSYGTPIAWHHASGWEIPAVRYSVTTSKHQGIVRRAVW
jgi:hypothetical protein